MPLSKPHQTLLASIGLSVLFLNLAFFGIKAWRAHPSSKELQGQVNRFAEEANRQCPVEVGGNTNLLKVTSEPGLILKYECMVNSPAVVRASVAEKALIANAIKSKFIDFAKGNPEFRYLRAIVRAGATAKLVYSLPNGDYFLELTLSPEDLR